MPLQFRPATLRETWRTEQVIILSEHLSSHSQLLQAFFGQLIMRAV